LKLQTMKRIFIISAAFGVILLVFTAQIACAVESQHQGTHVLAKLEGTCGGNLVVAVSSDPKTFNRMLTAGLANSMIANRIAADLVHINRESFELEPSLASSWEIDDSGRTYTFHLRRNLRFSDGAPFDAKDVIFTLDVLGNPKSGALQGEELRVEGEFPTVSKVDDYTIRITFPRPVGMGLRMFDSIPILPKHKLLEAYQDGTFKSTWGPNSDPGDVVGLGPFRLRAYERGVKVVLERNPYYWKKDKSGQTLPYLDSLTFLIIQDRNAQALRFQSGEVDLVYLLNAENYAGLRRFQKQRNFTLQDLGPGLGMDFLWFNLKPGNSASGKPYVDPEKQSLFNRTEFRQAVSYALDRQGMNRTTRLGLGEPQFGPISSGNSVWYHNGGSQTDRAPQRSIELLKKIGLKDLDGDGILEYGAQRRPLEISLLTDRTNRAREKMAEIAKSNLAEVGIRVNVQLLLPNELASRFLGSFDYEAILFGLTPTDIVPDLQAAMWYSSGKLHVWNPSQKEPQTAWEAEIDQLTSRLVITLDSEDRKEVFKQIQKIWSRELPTISTVAPNILVGWKNNLGNLRPSILAPFLLWNAEEITKSPR